LNLKTEIDVNI